MNISPINVSLSYHQEGSDLITHRGPEYPSTFPEGVSDVRIEFAQNLETSKCSPDPCPGVLISKKSVKVIMQVDSGLGENHIPDALLKCGKLDKKGTLTA